MKLDDHKKKRNESLWLIGLLVVLLAAPIVKFHGFVNELFDENQTIISSGNGLFPIVVYYLAVLFFATMALKAIWFPEAERTFRTSSRAASETNGTGYVYVLTNPSIPGQVKVGFTTRTPQQRCAEISRGTGIPTPFEVAFQERFLDAHGAEREIHAILERQGMRTSGSREFFIATVDEAAAVIRAVKERLYG